jgi:hypothetical protein
MVHHLEHILEKTKQLVPVLVQIRTLVRIVQQQPALRNVYIQMELTGILLLVCAGHPFVILRKTFAFTMLHVLEVVVIQQRKECVKVLHYCTAVRD